MMSPSEMALIVMNDKDTVIAMLDTGPCGLVLHTEDYTRFLCRDERGTIRLEEPGLGQLYVLNTMRTAKSMLRYWNSKQTDKANMVTVSLRRDALTGYIDRLNLLLEALYDLNQRRRYDA